MRHNWTRRDERDKGLRILGLDVGTRRIGVALSDPLRVSAQPLEVIQRGGWDHDLARILALVREWGSP